MVDAQAGGERIVTERHTAEVGVLEGGFSKLSWRSVFGGTFAALGIWILLGAFGLAIGLTMVSPQDPSLSGASTWLGVWSLIVPILALFVGTLVATRAAGGIKKLTGVLYGVVVWGFTTFVATMLAVWLMGSVVGQTLRVGTSVVSGVGGAAASVAGGVGLPGDADLGEAVSSIGGFLNVDRDEILSALNQELAEEGLPPVEPEELQAAIQNAVNTALAQGSISAEMFEDALVQETQLSREQVQQTAQQLQQQWDQLVGTVGTQLSSAAGAAGDAALRSLDAIGNAMWWIFGSMLLGLAASIGAGMMATNGRMRPTAAERIPVRHVEEAYAVR